MSLAWKDLLKESVASGGTGTITLGSAPAGFQAFAAGDDGKLFPYSISDGTAWETGYGTYTHSGTTFARTLRTDSSTGSALNVTTAAFLFIALPSAIAKSHDLGAVGANPGGRLTLTTGVPLTTADVTGAATVYYTPCVHNVIRLWDGNIWAAIEFAETSLALGTLTSGLPYDVFGYLSSGALALELLAWTSGTARATAVTLQDGRYCKSGAKDRLLLGTFYTTATTTTEDSLLKRFLSNVYNRSPRPMQVNDSTASWTYGTATWRSANNNAANRVQAVSTLGDANLQLHLAVLCSLDTTLSSVQHNIGEGVTNAASHETISGSYGYLSFTTGAPKTDFGLNVVLTKYAPLGFQFWQWIERAQAGLTATTFGLESTNYTIRSGLAGSIDA